jgi:ABC-type dipeptide/oligopeptide/nickel transport systems, permease components
MKFVVKKIGTLIITLLIISLVTFLAFQIIPGDSVLASLGTHATKEQVAAMREELGYNKSISERYLLWLSGAVHGDFGKSTQYDMTVKKLVSDRLPVTAGLGVISIILIILIALPLGIYTAKRKGSIMDKIILVLNQIGMAIPSFFLGMIITLVFGILLKWFTPGKYITLKESFWGYIKYLIFPAISIAVPKIAMMVKFLRSSILRQLDLDYVKTARSKGNSENQVLYGHILKNALIPVITFLGMIIAEVLAGSIIIEQVFNLPGLGRLLVVSISNRDFAVVQAIVLYIAVLVVVINFLVDILYQYIDPRLSTAD